MSQQMVTANRLRDGAVVFLAAGGRWTTRVGEGHVAETENHAAELLRRPDQQRRLREDPELLRTAEVMVTEIVAPYLIEVTAQAAGWSPTRYRERIRAEGPSVGEFSDAGHPTAEGN